MEISSIYLIRVKERDIEEIEKKQYSVIVKSVPKVMEKNPFTDKGRKTYIETSETN